MATGTVTSFNTVEGYGLIAPDDHSGTVYVHFTAVDGDGFRELQEGQQVEYEAERGPAGLQATTVRVL
ncbi:MAG: cold-shock protein [Citricoccus sp.]|nr:cold-shock protein [Citricoccus sp. WCRC_4]